MKKNKIKLVKLEKRQLVWAMNREVCMEFHINNDVRKKYELSDSLFSLTGNVFFADLKQVRELTFKFNSTAHPERYVKSGELYAMGLIDEIMHYVVALYREQVQPDVFITALSRLETKLEKIKTDNLLNSFSNQFPPRAVYKNEMKAEDYLNSSDKGENCRALSIEETMLLSLANLNPAFRSFKFLFDDNDLSKQTVYPAAIDELKAHLKELPVFGPTGMNLWDFLRAPALASPDSLLGQLEYMRKNWGLLISRYMARLLMSLDIINEEEKPSFFGPGPTEVMSFSGLDEYERFSPDQEWMPRTVLIAKSTLVWLYQLSQKYKRDITQLDHIPDEELDELKRRGFTGLWLIGIWERSQASKIIKQWTGNPEAAASAYSLHDYDIADELGGWGALNNLRERCIHRGIRLGSDMVPNHTGIDSRWIVEHPDRFLQLLYPPFPTYNYNCGNLSGRDDITVQIEEHYFSRNDAAVVFKRIDNNTGETRFIYHGNDGTSMPWNDTAQIDFLNPEAREAVISTIIGVCKQFSIVRFDAAMTLAKRHIQRLWFPAPGTGGAIASRAEHAISTDEFNSRIPNEFWREVVDRCAVEAPNTLLLAEAFWMMEGYFVRTLGMHRVYNSAFMNMLKNEENEKYRKTIKNTMEFDPEILKRFVNFMNNPDEETAVAQFGKGDKYFGVCTLLVTMPGLPMFGHGQIDGFEEKYGMEYRRSYRDEQPDSGLVDRHEREIFPLMKRRYLFSGSEMFRLYDFYYEGNSVNENVLVYSNRTWHNGVEEKALIFYNNSYYETAGWIRMSDPAIPVSSGIRKDSLSEALALHNENQYFTLLREQISNLWYVRSSKAICENGLFAGLKGYQTQVFLDIYEVEDNVKGQWARLNHELSGRGVANPLTAIKDIFLGELYYRFSELFKPEIIDNLWKMQTTNSFEGKSSAEEFIKAALNEIAKENLYVDRNFTAVGINEIMNEYELFIGKLLKIKNVFSNPSFDDITKRNIDEKLLFTIIYAYGMLALLRITIGKEATGKDTAELVFTQWDIGRKLREILVRSGVSEQETWRITDIARAVLSKRKLTCKTKEKSMTDVTTKIDTTLKHDAAYIATKIIEENYLDEDFRRILGINIFDDAIWFNKEGFEAALFYSSLFVMVENDNIKKNLEIYNIIKKAEEKSNFRFDKLIDNLTDKPEKKQSSVSKTAKKAGKSKPANSTNVS